MQQQRLEYVSTEHLLIGIASQQAEPVGRNLGERRHRSLPAQVAVPGVRGGAKVTSPDAEGLYKALEKYSTGPDGRRHEGKLDPVIGRDQEIRRVI